MTGKSYASHVAKFGDFSRRVRPICSSVYILRLESDRSKGQRHLCGLTNFAPSVAPA